MRVLQVDKYYWPQGGASRYALDLSRLLASAGETIIPFASVHERNLPSDFGEYFVNAFDFSERNKATWRQKIRYAGQIMYSFEAAKKLNALLEKTPADIAHLHTIYHQISPSIIPVLKKRGIPIVMTLHDYKLLTPNYTFFHHGANHEEDARSWYLSCIGTKCFKDSRLFSALVTAEMIFHHKVKRYYEDGVDIFLAPSLFIKEMFIKFGWDSQKICHLPLPVLIPSNEPSPPGNYVLYAGRLVEEKGLLILLETARQTPTIPYKIVGDGPLAASMRWFLEKNSLTNVELIGYKQGKELEQLIDEARLVAAPSLWYENYPLSVLEAKAAGKVVIGSAIGGLPEMLPPELLVEPGNTEALAQKIETWFRASDQKLLDMGAALREEVKKINDPEKHRQVIVEVYNQLLRR